MAERRYFGTDGIRGRVGEGPISADFFLKLGWAAGRALARDGHAKVVIGKDTRISGYMFEAALEAGLVAAGANVMMLGPIPTPAVAYLTRSLRADAGIVISASHNPHQDNGIKFFSAHGEKLSDAVENAIEAALEEPFSTVASEKLGKARRIDDAATRYAEFCKSTVDESLSLAGMKIVLDCAHGATYAIAPALFAELGAEIHAIGVSPDGLNINRDCGSMHMQALAAEVLARGADLGIAFDGDGDRLQMVDAAGVVVDGDELLYVLALAWQRDGRLRGPVVGTLMSNFALEQALLARGMNFLRANVGDRVFFGSDRSNIGADQRPVLERQARWLAQHAQNQVTVEGHADERGTREYNLALGQRRANAARDVLVASGVAGSRVQTVSFGKDRPEALSSDETSWSQNRRAVTVVR